MSSNIVEHWWPNAPRTALVHRVVDGDTIIVDMPWMDGTTLRWNCRLYGIDTPELRGGTEDTKEQAQACKLLLRDKLQDQRVLLEFYADRDPFGRILARVWWAPAMSPDTTAVTPDMTDMCAYMLTHGPGTVEFYG